MKPVDLESLYNQYLKGVVKANPDKYCCFDELEEDIAKLYSAWEELPLKELGNKTPKEYVVNLRVRHELCDYVEDLLEAGIEVSDIAAFELLNDADADELLARLCFSDIPEATSFAAEMLKEKGGQTAEDTFIEALSNPKVNDIVKLAAYEYLSCGQPQVVDRILDLLPELSEDQQGIFVEILAEYKNNKAIYLWLVTMLYRRDDIPLYADLLAKYEDPAAIEVLKGFSEETSDINYMEFLELRYAVERLGGELTMDKDFSEDPLFAFQHPKDNP